MFRELLGPGNTWPGSPFHEGPERIGVCERPLHEAAKVTPRCRRCQSVGISAKESCIQGAEVAQDKREIYVAGSKAKGAMPSETSSTLDRELNSWVLAMPDFSLALVQYLRTIFPFPLI